MVKHLIDVAQKIISPVRLFNTLQEALSRANQKDVLEHDLFKTLILLEGNKLGSECEKALVTAVKDGRFAAMRVFLNICHNLPPNLENESLLRRVWGFSKSSSNPELDKHFVAIFATYSCLSKTTQMWKQPTGVEHPVTVESKKMELTSS